ncbi:uncharacterized protein LOC111193542 [Astyanax mexicanus]|uniref:uncharacterized protein LOC111193542 n=1 Tax=Astyanax mexicanus TaxID=7994 RepID=UPI0020CB3982|nr:uncharacterized protein LOC111193542 [Astyanax mexicanus]
MVQMLKALIVPGVLAVAGCCWWWYSSRKKTPGTSQDSEEKEDELSSSSGEEQCAQSGTRAPLSSPEELPLQDNADDIQLAESSEQEMQLEEPITIIDDPQTEDTTVSAIELPELNVVEDLSSSSEDGQCAQSETSAPVSSPEELPLQDTADDIQLAESSEQEMQLEEPITIIDDPQTEDTTVSAIELPELSVVEDLSSSSKDGQCSQSETRELVSSPEELPLQDSVDSQTDGRYALSSPEELPLQVSVGDSQPAESSEGKIQLEELEVPTTIKKDTSAKGVPASFLGRKTKPLVRSTSQPVKPFFIRDEKYENTRESLSQVAWDSVMDDWY